MDRRVWNRVVGIGHRADIGHQQTQFVHCGGLGSRQYGEVGLVDKHNGEEDVDSVSVDDVAIYHHVVLLGP